MYFKDSDLEDWQDQGGMQVWKWGEEHHWGERMIFSL